MVMQTKECIGCGRVLATANFHLESRGSGGLRPRCKSCMSDSRGTESKADTDDLFADGYEEGHLDSAREFSNRMTSLLFASGLDPTSRETVRDMIIRTRTALIRAMKREAKWSKERSPATQRQS